MRKMQFLHAKRIGSHASSRGEDQLASASSTNTLNDAEPAAVEDGVEAMEKLLQQLADVHTPDSALAGEQNFTATTSQEGLPFAIATRKEGDPTHWALRFGAHDRDMRANIAV